MKQESADKRQWDEILGVCLINGREVNCTVDTGAMATIVQQRFVQEDIEKGNVKVEHCTERFVSANGVPVHIARKVECDLQIGANNLKHKIYVSVDIVDECLLGIDVLSICPSSKDFVAGLRRMFENGTGEEKGEGKVVFDSMCGGLSKDSSGKSEGARVASVEREDRGSSAGVAISVLLSLVHLYTWTIEQIRELLTLELSAIEAVSLSDLETTDLAEHEIWVKE